MKTILMTALGRQSKYRQIGLATAIGSVMQIRDLRKAAQEGKAKLAIVEAESIEQARVIVKNRKPDLVLDDGRTLCFGETSKKAIEQTEKMISEWDEIVRTKGKVALEHTRAVQEE